MTGKRGAAAAAAASEEEEGGQEEEEEEEGESTGACFGRKIHVWSVKLNLAITP